MNRFILFGVGIIVIVALVMSATDILLNSKDSSQIVLTAKVPAPILLEQLSVDDMIAYGFMWSFDDDEFKNGLFVNIHVQEVKTLNAWHSELIKTNYVAGDDNFCVILEKTIESVTTIDDSIKTVIESKNTLFPSMATNYLELKLFEDDECDSNIKAVVISFQDSQTNLG